MIERLMVRHVFIVATMVFWVGSCCNTSHAQLLASRKEYISVSTDVYELSVRKNGTVSIMGTNGEPLLSNAEARVRHYGESDYARLKINVNSVERFQAKDALGEGQGLVFRSRDSEWYWSAYPGKPYVSVRLVLINNRKSDMVIDALAPVYCASSSGAGLHMEGAADRAVSWFPMESGEAGWYSQFNLLRYPESERVYALGFVTCDLASCAVMMHRDARARENDFNQVIASCRYTPAITLKPGEKLESETLYFAVAEAQPHAAVQEFGDAFAKANHKPPARRLSGLYLDSAAYFTQKQPTEDEALQWLKQTRIAEARSGSKDVFILASGWESRPGDWMPDPVRFPNGFAALAEEVRQLGMRLGIRIRPFLVDPESDCARSHPEWLLPERTEDGLFILNPASSEVQQYLDRVVRVLIQDMGVEVLVMECADALLRSLPVSFDAMTAVQRYRLGLRTIRDSMQAAAAAKNRPGHLIVTPYHPAALVYADAVGPDWHALSGADSSDNMGSQLDDALYQQYWAVYAGVRPYPGPFGNKTSGPDPRMEMLRDMLATAFYGGNMVLGGMADECIPAQLWRTLSPTLPFPAVHVDRMQHAPSRVRHIPLRTDAGEWHLVACFNWSDATAPETIAAAMLGLSDQQAYALYEYYPGKYHGLIQREMTINVPAKGVRCFGLRPYEGRPMLLASDRHISQGALDHDAIQWDGQRKCLSGTFASERVAYRLRFLVPPPWQISDAAVNNEKGVFAQEDPEVICLDIPGTGEKISWSLTFK